MGSPKHERLLIQWLRGRAVIPVSAYQMDGLMGLALELLPFLAMIPVGLVPTITTAN